MLEAAFDEMHRSGFRGASLEVILARSGVTKGAMYHHFADKEALGHAVIDDVIAAIMREKWQRPLQQAENPIDALIAIIRSTSVAPVLLARGCPLNNMSQEMAPLDEGFRQRTAALFGDWRSAIAAALDRGRRRGLVRTDIDPDEIATFVIAAYEGYLSLAKSFQGASGLRAGLKTLAGYLRSLRPPGAGKAARAGSRRRRLTQRSRA
jgi:TetR/AcrR family transcriptional regulator, transcriptional repressor for nem operon